MRPRKSFGQNFLRDENICRKIVGSLDVHPGDALLEIGPGEGALTALLVPRLKRLTVVEIDNRLVERLRMQFGGGSVTIIHQDVLTLNLREVADTQGASSLRIVGNIPYNITSPILFSLLDNRAIVHDATLMMQREVARRLVAKPNTKDYGILSVFCQLFAEVALLFDVSPNAFFPRPKVVSSVVHLRMLPAPRYPVGDESLFRAMVRAVFGKRRKTLRNSLRYFLDDVGGAAPSSFDLSRRPEQLSIEELVALSNLLVECR